jgi:hypothetical protein
VVGNVRVTLFSWRRRLRSRNGDNGRETIVVCGERGRRIVRTSKQANNKYQPTIQAKPNQIKPKMQKMIINLTEWRWFGNGCCSCFAQQWVEAVVESVTSIPVDLAGLERPVPVSVNVVYAPPHSQCEPLDAVVAAADDDCIEG